MQLNDVRALQTIHQKTLRPSLSIPPSAKYGSDNGAARRGLKLKQKIIGVARSLARNQKREQLISLNGHNEVQGRGEGARTSGAK